jgi:hypothetical protein
MYFKNNINLVFIFLLIVSFGTIISGCSDEKRLQRIENRNPGLFQPLTKDSIGKTKVTYITHDSIIHLPGQTNTFTVTIPCPLSATYSHISHFKSGTATLQIDSGKATVICHDDSLNEIISWQNEIIDSNRTCIREGLAERLVPQAPGSFDDFCHWFTILILIGVALYFGGKYLPDLLKLIKGGI